MNFIRVNLIYQHYLSVFNLIIPGFSALHYKYNDNINSP